MSPMSMGHSHWYDMGQKTGQKYCFYYSVDGEGFGTCVQVHTGAKTAEKEREDVGER